jgi:hypothetical protein
MTKSKIIRILQNFVISLEYFELIAQHILVFFQVINQLINEIYFFNIKKI